MASDNSVQIIGNLTADPELRFTPGGAAVANFRVAITNRVKDGDSWKDGESSFFSVNVWRDQAEHVAESLSKGARVVVIGRLRTRSWETPEGDRRTVTEIEADEVAPSLRWATAKLERATKGDKPTRSASGWQRPKGTDNQPSQGGDFAEPAPF